MNPWCDPCGIFHPAGHCNAIADLRRNATPRVSVQQLPLLACANCGTSIDSGRLCDACNPEVIIANHMGRAEYLSGAD